MTLNHLQPRILIVEDEPALAMLLEDWLADAGFLIAGVAGGLEAGKLSTCSVGTRGTRDSFRRAVRLFALPAA